MGPMHLAAIFLSALVVLGGVQGLQSSNLGSYAFNFTGRHEPSVGDTPVNGYKYAYGQIQAESYDFSLGGSRMNGNGYGYVGYLDDGDSLGFYLVDFTSKAAGSRYVYIRVQNADPNNYPGYVYVYHAKPPSNPSSTAIGQHQLLRWDTGFYTALVPLDRAITGVTDIYLVFKSSKDTSVSYYGICDIDYIQFQ